MSSRRLGRLSARLVFVLAVSGCYGPGPTAIESGLDRDQQLSELSPAETIRLCDATNEASMALYTPELQAEALCTAEAVLLSAALSPSGLVEPAMCERERDACIENGEAYIADIRFCNGAWLRWFRTCNATIDSYEKCMSASLRAGATAFREEFSCAAPVDGGLDQREPVLIPECAGFPPECGWPQQ